MKLSYRILVVSSMLMLGIQSLSAVSIWPDRVRPPLELEAAINIAENRLADVEKNRFYCINATLLADGVGDSQMGFWRLGYATEKGRAFNISVRMDSRVNIQEVRGFEVGGTHRWPDTVAPPAGIKEALAKAMEVLQDRAATHYVLNATLVSGSRSVMKKGMWNLVYQTEVGDPVLVNVPMQGKAKFKKIERIRQLSAETSQ